MLDPTAEENIKIKGLEGIFISETSYIIKELVDIIEKNEHSIRIPKTCEDPVPFNQVHVVDLSQTPNMPWRYAEIMDNKDLGILKNTVILEGMHLGK